MWSHREIQKLRLFKDPPYSSLIQDYAESSTLLTFGSNPFFSFFKFVVSYIWVLSFDIL